MARFIFAFVLIPLAVTGCSYFVSWDESVRGGVGRPFEDIKKTWGEPDSAKTIDSNSTEYMYHLKKLDPSCFHWWQVDKNGIIEGYRYKGRCRPIG